ncbi:SHOCT domain-containing protein [Polynucleobacter ibericus]|uniref:SHOCT domain-containing protein n=1 Tax=Polynucleobacter ibericus TaxID=1819725 RepID=UPI001BFEE1E8|nr:SHOCT domain-containing protein [Polynucleobacter ibericus]QWE09435.1 SHOCT domain-containing protein [Polynucleobacter ibericus]
MIKKTALSLVSASLISMGCTTTVPNAVPVAQAGDSTLSCDAITNEMQQMIAAQLQANGDKNRQTGTNAALGVAGIFTLGIPWFFMNIGDTPTIEERAARARYERLQQMGIDRNCPPAPYQPANTSQASDQATPAPAVAPVAPIASSAPTSVSSGSNVNNSSALKTLEELNVMLQKGLITTQEYNKKKAEILKNM